jgi:hypothetical protein
VLVAQGQVLAGAAECGGGAVVGVVASRHLRVIVGRFGGRWKGGERRRKPACCLEPQVRKTACTLSTCRTQYKNTRVAAAGPSQTTTTSTAPHRHNHALVPSPLFPWPPAVRSHPLWTRSAAAARALCCCPAHPWRRSRP